MAPKATASGLMDVILKGFLMIPGSQIHAWINTIGLILARLPESYWSCIFEKLQEVMNMPLMLDWDIKYFTPFKLFNFELCSKSMLDRTCVNVLAVVQSTFHHFGVGQIGMITESVL